MVDKSLSERLPELPKGLFWRVAKVSLVNSDKSGESALVRLGICHQKTPESVIQVMRYSYVTDPDGNVVTVQDVKPEYILFRAETMLKELNLIIDRPDIFGDYHKER